MPIEFVRALKALADRLRLRMLAAVAQEELTVGEVQEVVASGQSSVSRNLAILRTAGFVQDRKDGTSVYFSARRDMPEPAREPAFLRLWCAKEAVAKAVGRGLSAGTHSVVVRGIDAASGLAQVELSGELAAEFPALAGSPLKVATLLEKDYVVAATLCARCNA